MNVFKIFHKSVKYYIVSQTYQIWKHSTIFLLKDEILYYVIIYESVTKLEYAKIWNVPWKCYESMKRYRIYESITNI